MIISTQPRLLRKVANCMRFLSGIHGENCLFVSQWVENEKDGATVQINLVKEDREDDYKAYLAVRRLLTALAYRVSENTPFELEFDLKQKDKGK